LSIYFSTFPPLILLVEKNMAGLFTEFAIWGAARKAGSDISHHRKGATK
jgi:hypothetical protein